MKKEKMAASHFTSNGKNNSHVSYILPALICYFLYGSQFATLGNWSAVNMQYDKTL
jgi:hypothetical protein